MARSESEPMMMPTCGRLPPPAESPAAAAAVAVFFREARPLGSSLPSFSRAASLLLPRMLMCPTCEREGR